MNTNYGNCISEENHVLKSKFLKRDVLVDCYFPKLPSTLNSVSLLLINDGQDLITMDFKGMLDKLNTTEFLSPLLCVGIHCSADRKNEYGTANILDYDGRGAKAALYTSFIFQELLPFIRKQHNIQSFKDKSYAGFSLGGLSAMDIVWNHAEEFIKVGAFSASFWWRDKDQNDAKFDEKTNRIMHRQIREGRFAPWLQFFIEVGTLDETADRNNNGVIDSIDDVLSLIEELKNKGYKENDIKYLELKEGKHDVATWAKAFPDFLKWGWSNNS